jgi:hypothetical protein
LAEKLLDWSETGLMALPTAPPWATCREQIAAQSGSVRAEILAEKRTEPWVSDFASARGLAKAESAAQLMERSAPLGWYLALEQWLDFGRVIGLAAWSEAKHWFRRESVRSTGRAEKRSFPEDSWRPVPSAL